MNVQSISWRQGKNTSSMTSDPSEDQSASLQTVSMGSSFAISPERRSNRKDRSSPQRRTASTRDLESSWLAPANKGVATSVRVSVTRLGKMPSILVASAAEKPFRWRPSMRTAQRRSAARSASSPSSRKAPGRSELPRRRTVASTVRSRTWRWRKAGERRRAFMTCAREAASSMCSSRMWRPCRGKTARPNVSFWDRLAFSTCGTNQDPDSRKSHWDAP